MKLLVNCLSRLCVAQSGINMEMDEKLYSVKYARSDVAPLCLLIHFVLDENPTIRIYFRLSDNYVRAALLTSGLVTLHLPLWPREETCHQTISEKAVHL